MMHSIASLSTFQNLWCSKQEYDESGPGIVHRSTCCIVWVLHAQSDTFSRVLLNEAGTQGGCEHCSRMWWAVDVTC